MTVLIFLWETLLGFFKFVSDGHLKHTADAVCEGEGSMSIKLITWTYYGCHYFCEKKAAKVANIAVTSNGVGIEEKSPNSPLYLYNLYLNSNGGSWSVSPLQC
jgi:hypothetical protein